MLKILVCLASILIVSSCSQGLNQGSIEKNLEATDKIYGRCNNPNRQFTEVEKEICVAKVRAAGPDGEIGEDFNITDLFDRFNNPDKNVVYAGSSANQFLWNGALSVLEAYPLKTVDSQGGFIASDWILDKNEPNKRCQIKVNVTSQDLISNGVKTKIICQEQENNRWYVNDEILIEQEKKITLKILEIAQELSNIENLS